MEELTLSSELCLSRPMANLMMFDGGRRQLEISLVSTQTLICVAPDHPEIAVR